jgi:hypothetical protein
MSVVIYCERSAIIYCDAKHTLLLPAAAAARSLPVVDLFTVHCCGHRSCGHPSTLAPRPAPLVLRAAELDDRHLSTTSVSPDARPLAPGMKRLSQHSSDGLPPGEDSADSADEIRTFRAPVCSCLLLPACCVLLAACCKSNLASTESLLSDLPCSSSQLCLRVFHTVL